MPEEKEKGGQKEKEAESLVHILSDEALKQAFLYFLEERHTEENFHLWCALEAFDLVETPEERVSLFTQICRTFILPNCPTPVNYASAAIEPVRDAYKQLASGDFEVPPQVFYPLRHSCWDQLLFGCFPPFLESGVYADFLDEVVDSTKVGFSRSKAENFFGMKIEGTLRRQEVINVINLGIRHKRTGVTGFFGRNFGKKKHKTKRTRDSGSAVVLESPRRTDSAMARNTSTQSRENSSVFSAEELAKMPNFGGMTDDEEASDAPMGIYGLV